MKKSELRKIIKEEIKKATNEDMTTWIDRSNLDGVGSSLVDHMEELDSWVDDDDLNISGKDFRTMASKLGTPLNNLKVTIYATGEGWDSTGDYAKVSKVYQRPSDYPRHRNNNVAFDIDEKNGILFFSKYVGGDTGAIKGFIFN